LYIESDSSDASTGQPATWGDVLGHRQAWSFIAAKFFTDPVWWFFLIWLPDFFKKTRHLDIKNSWTLLVSIYSIITVLSICGGWLSGYLVKSGWSVTRARKLAMAIFAVCVVPIAFVTHVNNWTAVLLLGLAGAAHQAWSATIYTTVSDMFPKRMVAKLIGVGSAAGSVGGMIFPLLTGFVLDHDANGYAVIFAFCGGAYLLALVINHLIAPSFDPVL
jgi:ACS family hexuronate transporter-like MFS transporter